MGALLPMGAGAAVLHREPDFNHLMASSVLSRSPTATGLSSRTGGALILPIHHKLLSGEPSTFARLPVIIIPAWSKEINPKVALARDELLCVHIARIDDMHHG